MAISAIFNSGGYEMIRKSFNTDEIIEKIYHSNNEFRIIGTTSFDFNWSQRISSYGKSLEEILVEKFFCENSKYEITIICESDPQILQHIDFQYASLKNAEKDFVHYVNINKSRIGLREYFRGVKDENLDPTEVVYREALDKIFDNARIHELIKNLISRGYDESEVVRSIANYMVCFFEHSIFNMVASTPEYKVITKSLNVKTDTLRTEFSHWIRGLFSQRISELNTIDSLFSLILSYSELSVNKIFEYNGIPININFTLSKEGDVRNAVVDASFEYLASVEGTNYDDIKNVVSSLAFQKREEELNKLRMQNKYKQRFFLKTLFDSIKNQILKITDFREFSTK